MFDQSISIFQEIDEEFTKTVIKGVFCTSIKGISLESKGEVEANSVKVIVPVENMPNGFEPKEGSYFCKGSVLADYEDSTSLVQSEPTFLIVSCDKMDYGNRPVCLLIGR